MAQIALGGNPVNTSGDLPSVGAAPSFSLTRADLTEVSAADYAGKKVILNIFPSVDTPTCAASVRAFNERASSLDNTVVVCVSADLPFAQGRFCGIEGLSNVETASSFRTEFGQEWGLDVVDGPLRGLLARAVVVLDETGTVTHTELVHEIALEPNYDAAIAALG